MTRRLPITRDAFPQLADLAAGYLDQDYQSEHPTPAAARDAFLEVADQDERERFAHDIDRFLRATASAPWDEVRQAWAALGAEWIPPDRRALERLLAAGSRTRGARQ